VARQCETSEGRFMEGGRSLTCWPADHLSTINLCPLKYQMGRTYCHQKRTMDVDPGITAREAELAVESASATVIPSQNPGPLSLVVLYLIDP